jgi:cobalt-precorrin 5A hydrolase
MVVGEAMIAAGLGSRQNVTVDEVLAAIRAVADQHDLAVEKISLLATGQKKASEPAFAEAALRLGLPLEILSDEALAVVGERTLTHSGNSLSVTGVPSLSETSALAAAGPNSTLLGPRVALGPVTCALARSKGER